MFNLCDNDIFLAPVRINRIYDNIITQEKITHNKFMKFDIVSDCIFGMDIKVVVKEVTIGLSINCFDYNMFINGYEVKEVNKNKCIKITKKYISNVLDKCKNSIVLNINEILNYDVTLHVNISGIAYTNDYQCHIFNAYGCIKDSINAVIVSNICIPNSCEYNTDIFIKQSKCLYPKIDPNFLFVSPIPGECCSVEGLLGKTALNYTIDSNMVCLFEDNLNLMSTGVISPKIINQHCCDFNKNKCIN